MRLLGVGQPLRNVFALALVVVVGVLSARLADAGQIAFTMSGQGVIEAAPVTAGTQSDYQEQGTATLFGHYTGDGRLRFDELITATSGKFSSALPFIVTAENGDQLCFTYVGDVERTDMGDGLITTRWVADFKPIVGSGTGQFEQVTGGSFRMTAETDAFSPESNANVAYRTAGTGSLLLVPEPAVALGLTAGGLALCFAGPYRRATLRRR
ncbi:MAG: hypothetical protein U0795_06210 [Pirellulales bacterium]